MGGKEQHFGGMLDILMELINQNLTAASILLKKMLQLSVISYYIQMIALKALFSGYRYCCKNYMVLFLCYHYPLRSKESSLSKREDGL